MEMDRRDFIKHSGLVTALLASSTGSGQSAPGSEEIASKGNKKNKSSVIVAGGGIAGLSNAYELMKRGHEVTVLEASQRAGGHVRTIHDPLAEGLYADLGAEQCTKPGYEIYRAYADEFDLELLPYPRRTDQLTYIRDKPYTEEMLRDRKVLLGFGFSKREASYMSENGINELPSLFYRPYLDAFEDEYQPFGVGLEDLDLMAVKDLLKRENASERALLYFGGSSASALQAIWNAAILKHRKVPLIPTDLFRIKGGNQRMIDAFATRLGSRIRLGSPVTKIEHSDSGVTVHFKEFGESQSMTADYLVNAIPLTILQRIPIEPYWSEEKAWVIKNTTYDFQSRIVFQTRTPFWKREGYSPNIACRLPHLHLVWEMAEEVKGDRSILIGSANAGTTPEQALNAYRKRYPGKSIEIEHTLAHHWIQDPWAPVCERQVFGLGKLKRFWPEIIRPHGRIHFAGAYADNLSWGQEAATRSANRVAREIDEAS
ncbi:MAG: FAD-dependent oxidoreductase [Opitutales bacterium]|nr:FAD-dependent oxidoreductase [Opitutales bacterium]